MVMAVSRCMKARALGSSTTITRSASPVSNRPLGQELDALGVVRSPIPIITVPWPSTVMSPPSTVAGACTAESLP